MSQILSTKSLRSDKQQVIDIEDVLSMVDCQQRTAALSGYRTANERRLSYIDYLGCSAITQERPYVSSVFRPLVKQTSVGLDRQFGEPQRVKQAQKYGAVPGGQDDSQANNVGNGSESDIDSGSTSSVKSSSWFCTKRSVTVCMMAVANLCSMVAFSCIAPFYPAEAKAKGLTDSKIGIIFGVFELIVCISSLILGKYMVYIGSKRLLVTGLMITSISAILFGFLRYLPSGWLFFLGSISVRTIEAIGDACFVTASFVISAKCFPENISTVIGILETFAGIGFTAGPMIGAVLYDFGGFQLPFLVLGAILLLVSLVSCYVIENYRDEPSGEKKGMLGMLKVPVVWVILSAVVLYALSNAFLDPTLAEHLSSFNLSTTVVGLIFLLDAGIYTITAPLWGYIYDRWHCAFTIMIFGAVVSAFAMFIIGPAPYLKIEKNLALIAIGLCLMGVTSGAFYIPTFHKCLETVRNNDYEDSFETYAGVSGIFQSAFSFGSFIGPTIGGVGVQWFGFAWTCTAMGFVFVIMVLLLVLYYIIGYNETKAISPESVD